MKFDKGWLDKKWVSYTIATCSAVVLYMVLSNISIFGAALNKAFSVTQPVVVGAIIAYVEDPLVKFFENRVLKKMKNRKNARVLGVAFTTIVVVALAAVLIYSIIPQLVSSLTVFFNNIGTYGETLQHYMEILNQKFSENKIDMTKITDAVNELIGNLTAKIADNAGKIVNTSFSVGKSAVNFLISFILAIYFLANKEYIKNGFNSLMRYLAKGNKYDKTAKFIADCNGILVNFMVVDLIDALIVGLVNELFMLLTGMPYHVLISVVVGVTNLVPTFGPFVGGAIGAFFLLLVNPWYSLWFIIFTLALQTFDGYILKPKLFGDTMGVPGIWILVSIVLGGRMFGVWGIILAIPVAAIIDSIIEQLKTAKKKEAKALAKKEQIRKQKLMREAKGDKNLKGVAVKKQSLSGESAGEKGIAKTDGNNSSLQEGTFQEGSSQIEEQAESSQMEAIDGSSKIEALSGKSDEKPVRNADGKSGTRRNPGSSKARKKHKRR
jgi:predicted PurR-regulated permease PerM